MEICMYHCQGISKGNVCHGLNKIIFGQEIIIDNYRFCGQAGVILSFRYIQSEYLVIFGRLDVNRPFQLLGNILAHNFEKHKTVKSEFLVAFQATYSRLLGRPAVWLQAKLAFHFELSRKWVHQSSRHRQLQVINSNIYVKMPVVGQMAALHYLTAMLLGR